MARAAAIRSYVRREVEAWSSKGYAVAAYGAVAKGMTLLHFMLAGEAAPLDDMSFLDFVLDDAPLKQGTFCPGTKIPVFSTQGIYDLPRNLPLAVVVLAWNFFDEIALKLKSITETRPEFQRDIIAIVPFPEPRVVRISPKGQQLLRDFPNRATAIPNPLLFIIQHAPMFD